MRLSSGLASLTSTGACVLALAGCTCLTEPTSKETAQARAKPPTAAQASTPTSATAPEVAADAERLITTSHILVAYAGAERSTATRTKDAARKRAGELLARLRAGEDFGALALAESDDRTTKVSRGSLGTVPAKTFVKPFADAALALRPGEVSDVVETSFGFHLIQRDK